MYNCGINVYDLHNVSFEALFFVCTLVSVCRKESNNLHDKCPLGLFCVIFENQPYTCISTHATFTILDVLFIKCENYWRIIRVQWIQTLAKLRCTLAIFCPVSDMFFTAISIIIEATRVIELFIAILVTHPGLVIIVWRTIKSKTSTLITTTLVPIRVFLHAAISTIISTFKVVQVSITVSILKPC